MTTPIDPDSVVERLAALRARVVALPEDAPNLELIADLMECAADASDFQAALLTQTTRERDDLTRRLHHAINDKLTAEEEAAALSTQLASIRAETIEACAKIAEEYPPRKTLLPLCSEEMNRGAYRGMYEAAEEIAAAIRTTANLVEGKP